MRWIHLNVPAFQHYLSHLFIFYRMQILCISWILEEEHVSEGCNFFEDDPLSEASVPIASVLAMRRDGVLDNVFVRLALKGIRIEDMLTLAMVQKLSPL